MAKDELSEGQHDCDDTESENVALRASFREESEAEHEYAIIVTKKEVESSSFVAPKMEQGEAVKDDPCMLAASMRR